MKVLQINTVCGQGSTGKIAVAIANTLIKNGHDSLICYGRGNSPYEKSFKFSKDFSVMFHAFLCRITDKHGLYSKSDTRALIAKIKEYSPDVIHLHNIHGYFLNYKLLFSFLAEYNRPIVWTLHDCWSFTGHCAYFTYVKCSKWESGCYKCPEKGKYPASILRDNSKKNYLIKKECFTLPNNMTIVTPSVWLKELVEKSFLGKYAVKVINNGIDLSIFKPTECDFRERYDLVGKKVILGVANVWDDRKGFGDFVSLSKQLFDNERIVLVGLSDKQLKGLPQNIIGIKRTANQIELAGLYSTADVFFNPTYEDNFPTTNLEALACGTPIITYDTGGCGETIKGMNGVAIEVKGFQQVKSLIGESSFTKNTGNVTLLSHIEGDVAFNKYVQLYQQIEGC